MPEGLNWLQLVTSGGSVTITLVLVYAFWRWELRPQKARDQRLYDDLLARSEAREDAAGERNRELQALLREQGSSLKALTDTQQKIVSAQTQIITSLAALNERVPSISRHVFWERPVREDPAD